MLLLSGPAALAQPRAPGRLGLVPNLGQWHDSVRFATLGGPYRTVLHDDGATLLAPTTAPDGSRRTDVVRLVLRGARRGTAPRGERRLPTTCNFFLGADIGRWRAGVPTFGTARSRDVVAGVDVVWRAGPAGVSTYDLEARSADRVRDVVIECRGARSLVIEPDGRLAIETESGVFRQSAPRSFAVLEDGRRTPVESRFRLVDEHAYGFSVDGGHEGPIVIDPGIEWSTHLGGGHIEKAEVVGLAPSGQVVVAGQTRSLDFPVTSGGYDQSFNGLEDVFVAWLSADGATLDTATYIGGGSLDEVRALQCLANGDVVLGGSTVSGDFPTTPGAYLGSPPGVVNGEGFIVRVRSDGGSLVFSTLLGGAAQADYLLDFQVDAAGIVTATGETRSGDFPTTAGAFDQTYAGGIASAGDAFVARLDASGSSLIYSTFLGGTSGELCYGVDVDQFGRAIVTGWTLSSDYPSTPGAFDETHDSLFSPADAFVTRLDANGSSLSYSTFLGAEHDDIARAIAVDRHGRATVVGTTYSYLFPVTSGAFDTFCPQFSCEKGFVTRLAEDGSALVWSTWLGGFNGPEPPAAVAVDEGGTTFVVGQTNAEDFPITVGAFDRALNDGLDTGKLDGFLARLGPDGGRLFYSTFLGGAVQDEAHGLAVDSDQSVVVAGVTWSDDFPTTPGAYDTVKSPGFPDGFVTRLDPSPTGATKYGTSTPGGLGPLAVGVTAAPTVGRADFGVFCVATPPGGAGLVCLSSGPAPGPLDVSGAAFFLDLAGLLVLPLVGGPEGYTEVPAPIPADPSLAGLKAYVQFLFQDPAASGGVAASNALEIEVNS